LRFQIASELFTLQIDDGDSDPAIVEFGRNHLFQVLLVVKTTLAEKLPVLGDGRKIRGIGEQALDDGIRLQLHQVQHGVNLCIGRCQRQ